jgi:hypothetical protein
MRLPGEFALVFSWGVDEKGAVEKVGIVLPPMGPLVTLVTVLPVWA